MQEHWKEQQIPVKVYRTEERLMIAAPMPGMEPEGILVDITPENRLILHGDLRGELKDIKELLLNEWTVGSYHRELDLPVSVSGPDANVTYGNGVLLVALPISEETLPAHLTIERFTPTHGGRQGNAGHPPS
jgi:HSP20 family protein